VSANKHSQGSASLDSVDPFDPQSVAVPRRLLSPVVAHVLGSAATMRGRLAALIGITAACLGIFIGGLSAIDSTLTARDQWFEEGKLADLQVYFRSVPSDLLPDFSEIDGVEDWRSRAVVRGTVEVPDNPHLTMQLVSGPYTNDLDLQSLVLLDGEYLDEDDTDSLLIDWHLSDAHQVGVGDELRVTIGDHDLTLTVRGVVRDAEFLLAPANPSLFIPTKGSLGIGFVNEDTIADIDGFLPVNSVLIRGSVDNSHLRQRVLDFVADKDLTQAYALGAEEQFSSLYLEKNLAAFATVVPVIVTVTGLSSIFVTFFLLAQWLTRERQALGVLMTLGYTARRLAMAFMVVIGILAFISILLGIAVGWFLARLFISKFATSVGLPLAATHLTGLYVWTSVAGACAMFMAAAIYAGVQVSHMTPLDAMRQVTSRGRHPGRLSGWLGAILPTSWLRIAVRNTVRDKLVSVLTIVSMALGFGITASFSIAFYSVISTAQSQVDASTWDVLVDFRTPLDEDTLTGIAVGCDAGDVTGIIRGAVQVTAHDRSANLYAGGFDPQHLWYKIPKLLEGEDVNSHQREGILIEVSTAQELGVGLGDTVALDSTSGHYQGEVIGIFSGALPGEARLTRDFAGEVFSLEGMHTGMLIQSSDDLEEKSKCLNSHSDVQQVMPLQEIREEITSLSDQITSILRIGSAVSIVVALLFVVACLGYTVLKRSGSYQLLRALGYRDRVVVATIVTETLILGICAMVLAVPIGALTADYTAWRISQVWFHIDTELTVADYGKTFIPALILLPLVALPMARSVLAESLDEFMRSRDMG